MSCPVKLQALEENMRERASGNSLTPLSFPKSRSALWDSSPVGETLRLHLCSHRKPRLVLLEKALRLAQRHARHTNEPRLCCFFLGSLTVDADEQGVTVTLDRFDPGRDPGGASCRVPSALLPGDVLLPCVFSTQRDANSDAVVQSEVELHQTFKALQQHVSGRQARDLSQLLKVRGHIVCSQQGDAAAFSLSWSAVSPAVFVDVQPVRALPIIPTALLRSLTGLSSLAQPPRLANHQRGFLTMDQSRKLLLLLESDPKASSLPLVGVWLSGVTHMCNPQVWAWCLRFLFSSALQDRVFSESGCFLLLLFSSTHRAAQFFQCRRPTSGPPQLDYLLLAASQSVTLYQQVAPSDCQALRCELVSEDHSRQTEIFRAALSSFNSAPSPATGVSISDQDSGVEDEDPSPRPSPSPHPPAQQARRVQPSVPELSLLIDNSFVACNPIGWQDSGSAHRPPPPSPAAAAASPTAVNPVEKKSVLPAGKTSTTTTLSSSSSTSSAPRPAPPHLYSTPNSNLEQSCTCCPTHTYDCTSIFCSPGLHPDPPAPPSINHSPPYPSRLYPFTPAAPLCVSPSSHRGASPSPSCHPAPPPPPHHLASAPSCTHTAAPPPPHLHTPSPYNHAAPSSKHSTPPPFSHHPAPSPSPSHLLASAPSCIHTAPPPPPPSIHQTPPPSSRPTPPSVPPPSLHPSPCPCSLPAPDTDSPSPLPKSCSLSPHPALSSHPSHDTASPVTPPLLLRPICTNPCCERQPVGVVPSDAYQLLLQQDRQLRLLQAQVQMLLEAQGKPLVDTKTPRSVASIATETGASLFWGDSVEHCPPQELQDPPPSFSSSPPSSPKPLSSSKPAPSSSSPASSSSRPSSHESPAPPLRPVGGVVENDITDQEAPSSPTAQTSIISGLQSPVLGESASMYALAEDQQRFYKDLKSQLTNRLQESENREEELKAEESRRRSLSVVSQHSQSSQSSSSSVKKKKQQQKSKGDSVVRATLRQLQQLGVNVDENLTESDRNRRQTVESASALAFISPAAVVSRLTLSDPSGSSLFPGGSVDLSLEANAIALRHLSDSELCRLSLGGHAPRSVPASSTDSLLSPSNMSLATRKYMRRYGLIEEESGEDEEEQEVRSRHPLTEALNEKLHPQNHLKHDLQPMMKIFTSRATPRGADKENRPAWRPSLGRTSSRLAEESMGNILDLSRLRELPKLF